MLWFARVMRRNESETAQVTMGYKRKKEYGYEEDQKKKRLDVVQNYLKILLLLLVSV